MTRKLSLLSLVTVLAAWLAPSTVLAETWKFVSIPDFMNVDMLNPEAGWEDSLAYVLDAVAAEEPDFVLVAGDMVRGHWHYGTEGLSVTQLANIYYPAWQARFDERNLPYYVAVGDHELGDNWWTDPGHAEAVPEYKTAFDADMQMPHNGPAGYMGTSYYFVHKNTLFVTVDVFEPDPTEGVRIKVTGEQLTWLDQVLTNNASVDHVIVQAHAPVLGPVDSQTYGAHHLMVEEAQDSAFWQMLSAHDVDLYLAGEHHATTVRNRDGIEQIVHGQNLCWNDQANYLVGTVSPTAISLELKEIDIYHQGTPIPQPGNQWDGPLDQLIITEDDKAAGFQTVGTVTLNKEGGQKVFESRTGDFHLANIVNRDFELPDAGDDFHEHDILHWELCDNTVYGYAGVVHDDGTGWDGNSEVPSPPNGSEQWGVLFQNAWIWQDIGSVEANVLYTFNYDVGDRTGHETGILTMSLWAGGDGPSVAEGATLLESLLVDLPSENGGVLDNTDVFGPFDSTHAGEVLWLKFQTEDSAIETRVLIDDLSISASYRPGDADGDGDVDNVDFGALYGAFTGPGGTGKIWTDGNFDSDGDVDNVDFGTLYGNYTGPLAGGMDFQVTPEPATLMVFGIGVMAVLRNKKK